MVKLTLKSDGGKFSLILGLIRSDLIRLAAEKPIVAVGKELGVPGLERVIVIGGETNEAIIAPFARQGLCPNEVVETARKADADPEFKFIRRTEEALSFEATLRAAVESAHAAGVDATVAAVIAAVGIKEVDSGA